MGNRAMRWVVAPGLQLQKLTTREPDDGMIECAIAALQPVLAADFAGALAAAPAGLPTSLITETAEDALVDVLPPEPQLTTPPAGAAGD
jgi:hypothetical protein